MRRIASSNEFFDILDKIGNGKFITIGYVTGANLDVPTVSRKNPLTNRMKKFPDYTVFGSEEEIGALVKITSYNMRYLNRTTVGQKYGEYKNSANDIRSQFGLDPIGSKESYKQGTDWSPNGPELYKGQNADLQSHSYNPQNLYGVKPKGVVYAVNKEGHIINALSQEQIQPYLKKKREIDGVAALRKMGVEEERIQDYINKIGELKFKYINFESNSILWIAATINGEKIVYINDNLSRAVDGIDIRPEEFRAIARERYQIDLSNLQEIARKYNVLINETERKMTNKKIFRMTESELRGMVAESVKKILSEAFKQAPWDEYDPIEDRDEMDIMNKNIPHSQEEGIDEIGDTPRGNFALNAVRGRAIARPRYHNDKYGSVNDRVNQSKIASMASDKAWDNYTKNPNLGFHNEAGYNYGYSKGVEEGNDTEEQTFQNNQNYSHFAVNKATNKIVNGWDYKDYDPDELRQFKRDYFTRDLIDYDLDPKQYKIVTAKYLIRQGIDPNDNNNWANN